jgi:catechol 2,3-dioxygenase-like lactoylglutathione lyase family enzyme
VFESINAVTLEVADMARSVRFYRDLGFPLRFGGEDATFTTFRIGDGQHLNLELSYGFQGRPGWGRFIIYVSDVDAVYRRALDLGLQPSTSPADAAWGERYFHLSDPDGHELSFARLLE